MSSDFESDEGLREYVEAELDRAVRVRHPELEVSFKTDHPTATPSLHLWWRISDTSAPGETFYTVEVRRDLRETLIWYGQRTAGPWETSHMMRQAVHVPFDPFEGFAPAQRAQIPARFRQMCSLGEVLEVMLGRRKSLYPMNCLTLT